MATLYIKFLVLTLLAFSAAFSQEETADGNIQQDLMHSTCSSRYEQCCINVAVANHIETQHLLPEELFNSVYFGNADFKSKMCKLYSDLAYCMGGSISMNSCMAYKINVQRYMHLDANITITFTYGYKAMALMCSQNYIQESSAIGTQCIQRVQSSSAFAACGKQYSTNDIPAECQSPSQSATCQTTCATMRCYKSQMNQCGTGLATGHCNLLAYHIESTLEIANSSLSCNVNLYCPQNGANTLVFMSSFLMVLGALLVRYLM